MLAKIKLRARLESVHAVTKKDLVGIHREDLLFGEAALYLHGQDCLLDLAPEVLVGREEKIARELHGQRRRSLGSAPAAEITIGRAQHAPNVYPPVPLEILVLD